jgi:hypothetical protein
MVDDDLYSDLPVNALADQDGDSDVEPDPNELDDSELDNTASNAMDDTDPELDTTAARRRLGKRYGQNSSSGNHALTHKFESKVRFVKARDKCTAAVAATLFGTSRTSARWQA